MVEALAVASGKGGTGKTTATLALGMALADDYDVTVVDADTGMANLLFHAGLSDAPVTLQDLLLTGTAASTQDAVYDRFGMRVVPCGTSLEAFQRADPERLRGVIAELAADTDILLLDSAAALGSMSAVLPIVLADRTVIVLQPTKPSLADGIKVQEYGRTYGTETAGVLFNKVRDERGIDEVVRSTEEYFGGQVLGRVPADEVARSARREGEPLLAHAPQSAAARAFRAAARRLDVRDYSEEGVANRFRSAVLPEEV
jgi:septum site-determining protein MinD